MNKGINVSRVSVGPQFSSALYRDAQNAIRELGFSERKKGSDSFTYDENSRMTVTKDVYCPELRLTVLKGTSFDHDRSTEDTIKLKEASTGDTEIFTLKPGTKPRFSVLGQEFGKVDCERLDHSVKAGDGSISGGITGMLFTERSYVDEIISNL